MIIFRDNLRSLGYFVRAEWEALPRHSVAALTTRRKYGGSLGLELPHRNFGVFKGLMLLLAAGLILTLTNPRASAAEKVTLSELVNKTHFHGIGVIPGGSGRIYLATHHGLFAIAPDGTATQISPDKNDYMGFTTHPTNRLQLYASGHPAGGGNLGFLSSKNGGLTWSKLSNGVDGPVDFHQMDVNKTNPDIIFGIHNGLQISNDGGRSWSKIGKAPTGLIDFAVSALDEDTLYAATREGLLISKNRGRSWKAANSARRPATTVYVTSTGKVYAYIFGMGFVWAREPALAWQPLNDGLTGVYAIHVAADPSDENKLYSVFVNTQSRKPSIMASRDGGKTWTNFGR